MKVIIEKILWLSVAGVLFVDVAAAQVACSAANQAALEQDYSSKHNACLTSQAKESEVSVRAQNITAQRSALFEKAAKKFGRACISNLLAGKKKNKCKGRAALNAAPSVKKLKAFDSSIKALNRNLAALSASRGRVCAEDEDAANRFAEYLFNCPPPNPTPPPDAEFRPDLASLLFYAVPNSETPLPVASWLMSRWAYYENREGYQFEFKTNGTFQISFAYKCSSICVIKEAFGVERGTYSFDGSALVLNGTSVIEFTHSNGTISNQTSAVESRHLVSLVTLEELTSGSVTPRQKLGIKLYGGGLFINADSSQEAYYLERSNN